MKKFYENVVKHTKLIIIVFMVLFLVCAICKQFISVNYDMNDYLPEDSASTVALDVMEREYEGGIPNARVMVKDVTIPEALEMKEKLLGIDGVTDVTWLDDSVNILVPMETMDENIVSNYYVDDNALFSVTIEETKRMEAVDAIRELIGDENCMTGSAVTTAVATTSTVSEITRIAVIAVIFTLAVLLLTTTSWIEPVIIFLGLGVAIIINAGSNLIFGEISFVTNAAGSILQLAVSLDYSVFLLHRFAECRQIESNPKKAMVNALCLSTGSIASSGLTTVIGFLALCLMRFQIGPDLGLALAKGIGISLITVFILMPAIFLSTYKWIDKTSHRAFLPEFKKFGKSVTKFMIPMVCVFFLLIVPAYLASNSNDYYYGASHIFNEKTQLGSDTKKIEDVFGKKDTYVLIVPKDSTATEKELSDALHEIPKVDTILSYVDTIGVEIPESYLEDTILSKLNSEHYTRMVLTVDVDYEGSETFELVETIRSTANEYYPGAYYLTGEGVSTYDLKNTVTADMLKVNLVAIGAVFLVLLLTMKSITLPIVLVASIETAIWINMAIPYFGGQYIFYIAYLIISSVQLGATVDYAILLTERYKENREYLPKKEAVSETISNVFVSILTSGSVLTVVGFLLGKMSTHGLLSQLGYFLGKGTICSVLIVLFVLPGLLYIFDKVVMMDFKKKTITKEKKNRKDD
ncbi:MAG: putative drug exporter of the superfamily [Clostridiales bacterium]|nr:putative drug exporter of the superfamily [Clostridiales bacterium]